MHSNASGSMNERTLVERGGNNVFQITIFSSTHTSPLKLGVTYKETGFKISTTSKATGQMIKVILRTKTHVWEITTKTVGKAV
jgi:hypothetical protein